MRRIKKILLYTLICICSVSCHFFNNTKGTSDKHNETELKLSIPEKWYGNYFFTINEDHEEWRDMQDIQLRIDKDSVTYEATGYQVYQYYLLDAKVNENELHFTYSKTIDANVESAVLEKTKDFGTLTFDGKNYLWTCPYIYIVYDSYKNGTFVLKRD